MLLSYVSAHIQASRTLLHTGIEPSTNMHLHDLNSSSVLQGHNGTGIADGLDDFLKGIHTGSDSVGATTGTVGTESEGEDVQTSDDSDPEGSESESSDGLDSEGTGATESDESDSIGKVLSWLHGCMTSFSMTVVHLQRVFNRCNKGTLRSASNKLHIVQH
jgi:hypothetical protein